MSSEIAQTIAPGARHAALAPPPHEVKQRWVARFQVEFAISTLIETGTYCGDMVQAQLNQFASIYSIELGADHAARAHERFVHHTHVRIIPGDSAELLSSLLDGISDRCLFWLDGHYSGGNTARGECDTPIHAELQAIFSHAKNDHVLLIDDARLFVGTDGYPTLSDIQTVIAAWNPSHSFRVVDDMVQVFPSAASGGVTL